MRIGRFELGPGALILIALVMLGLTYQGLKSTGMLPKSIMKKISPPGTTVDSQIPEKREKLEDIAKANIPASEVKAPERTTDDPPVAIGIWTWQTVSGL